jgi:hypothetical protein
MKSLFRRITLACSISLITLPFGVHAQVTISASDITPQIGDRQVLSVQTTAAELPEGLAGVSTGGPLTVDLRGGLAEPLQSLIMTSEILDPASVPESTEYPGTEFVQRFHGGVEGEDPAYYFWAGSDSGTETRLLGFDGDQTPQIDIETLYANATFPNQYPLAFGKQMTPVDVPFDDLLPGLDVMGSLAMQGSVDAWGTVQVPAGTFECLRLHIHGEAELSILVNGETLLLHESIEQYTWMSP